MLKRGKVDIMFTIKDMKETIQVAMGNNYGYKPPLYKIVILESADDGSYARFSIGSIEYTYTHSYTIGDFANPYNKVAFGTIERVARYVLKNGEYDRIRL